MEWKQKRGVNPQYAWCCCNAVFLQGGLPCHLHPSHHEHRQYHATISLLLGSNTSAAQDLVCMAWVIKPECQRVICRADAAQQVPKLLLTTVLPPAVYKPVALCNGVKTALCHKARAVTQRLHMTFLQTYSLLRYTELQAWRLLYSRDLRFMGLFANA